MFPLQTVLTVSAKRPICVHAVICAFGQSQFVLVSTHDQFILASSIHHDIIKTLCAPFYNIFKNKIVCMILVVSVINY